MCFLGFAMLSVLLLNVRYFRPSLPSIPSFDVLQAPATLPRQVINFLPKKISFKKYVANIESDPFLSSGVGCGRFRIYLTVMVWNRVRNGPKR